MIPSCASKYTYLNDKIVLSQDVDLPLATHVIYDVIRVTEGIPLFLESHAERFFNSFRLASLPYPFQKNKFYRAVQYLINYLPISFGNIRVAYYVANSPIFIVYQVEHSYPNRELYFTGVSSSLFRAERENPAIKQELQVRTLANNAIKERDVYDVILVDSDENVREGSRTNLFFVKGNELITSLANDVLGGITRKKVIELHKELGLTLVEKKISVSELESFDAAFFTGTSPKVLPIANIDSLKFDVSNPALLKIMQSFDEKIKQYLIDIKKI